MAEIEYGGIKVKGGKILIVFSLLGTLGGALWGGFEFYKDYLDMKDKIQSYTAPDLNYIEEELAVLKSEISSVLEEVTLVNDVAQSLKNDLRADIKLMKEDIRNIDKIVNDIEDRVKENEREIADDFKLLEQEISDKINKTLNNPLNALNN
jgi:septal ring factor EnvC (AmiA/AmiB activator)